jgi:hypothetical protein
MDDQDKVTYFAETDFRNGRTKFGIKKKDRTRHMYVIGKTGMGKSTLLENMAIQDIQNGEGIAFIDPHGSTAEKLLEYVPESRIKDVIYFAPFDLENPISFNVLESIDEERKHLVGAGLMNAFKKIFVDGEGKSSFSGRMEYILSMTLLALLDNPGETILGINRMYSDKDYRKKIVGNIKDPSVRAFWVDEYAKYSEKFAQEATASIQNKIGQFAANPLIRNLMGQKESSFDFRQAMDEKKILIVNLSKGKMGPDNMRLVGGMVVTKIYLAAMSRADASAKQLKELAPFYLYVDEFQNFANESFAEILSESRKYNLALTVANQYIDQMTEAVRGAILGNVGSMITFRIGAPDAEIMEKEFTPYFIAEDLVNLGFTQVYLKLMIDGVGSQPFSASASDTPPRPERIFEDEIIEHSRTVYCKPRAVVEENIRSWFGPARVTQPEEPRQEEALQKSYSERNIEKRPEQRTDYKSQGHGTNTSSNRSSAPVQASVVLNKEEGGMKELLERIKKGDLVEVREQPKKNTTHSLQTSIPVSAVSKDKAPLTSPNKLSLKDAIEEALREKSKKEVASTVREEPVKQEEPKTAQADKPKKENTSAEVSEDVLKNLLEL